MGEMIEYVCPNGDQVPGYLAKADQVESALVVLSEWWGLQDQIKGICDRFAQQGVTALAPDLFGGKVVAYHDMSEANKLMESLDFMDATDEKIGGAVSYLKVTSKKVGLTGFCMGGALTILGAMRLKGIDAAICFYGLPPEEAGDVARIKVPLQGHFASEDFWCTPPVVAACEQKLKQGGVDYQFYTYAAQHAFMNEQRSDVYDAQAADQAWQRCIEFCRQHLTD